MIRPLTEGDAPAVAALHAEAFPGYFLTRLGQRFLASFYAELARDPGGRSFVAEEHGRLVGFVACAVAPPAFLRGLYRRRGVRLAAAVALRLPADPGLVAECGRRALRRTRRTSGAGGPSAVATRLLSIGVSPPERGRGVAEALVDALCARLREEGVEEVGLSVLRANRRALAFYRRSGWTVEREDAQAVYLKRSTAGVTEVD